MVALLGAALAACTGDVIRTESPSGGAGGGHASASSGSGIGIGGARSVVPAPLCGPGLQPGAPWPMFGGCQSHASVSAFVGPKAPKLLWSREVGTTITTQIVIAADGSIYFGSYNKLVALHADGTPHWSLAKYPIENSFALTTPTIAADGTIYVGSLNGDLYAVLPDGTDKWAFSSASEIRVPPTVGRNGTVYVAAVDVLFALTPDGEAMWSYAPKLVHFFSSPTIAADGTVYVGNGGAQPLSHLVALTAAGNVKWKAVDEPYEIIRSTVIGSDGTIFASGYHELRTFSPEGAVAWTQSLGGGYGFSVAAMSPDNVLVDVANQFYETLSALRPSDGSPQWSGEMLATAVVVDAEGTIYAGFKPPKNFPGVTAVGAIRPDGSEKWSYPGFGSPIIAAPGVLYVANGNTLYALGD
jgi:outer membrane protein assembly factor BamB